MKTFKQFINEEEQFVTLEELLKGPCLPFFRQSQKKGMLFRGMDNKGERQGILKIGDREFTYYKKKVRKDRKPMSTSPRMSEPIDDWFEEEMGMRARSEALFCMGERGRAAANTYGDLAVILPIGKFIYCWSPKVRDLYDHIHEKFEDPERGGRFKPSMLGRDGKVDREILDAEMKELGYTINGFSEAVAKNNEIMLECDEYYVIPCEDGPELGDIKKAFLEA